MSRWRPVTSGIPQGSILGLVLFNIFADNTDSATECTLSKFAYDTKLCGSANTLDRGDAIQKDTGRLETSACADLMKINKAKCKVLHIVWGSPKKKK